MSEMNNFILPQFKEAQQFFPDQEPWPEGVYEFVEAGRLRGLMHYPIKYLLDTPDGTVEIFSGDWIVQTFDNSRWFVRVRE